MAADMRTSLLRFLYAVLFAVAAAPQAQAAGAGSCAGSIQRRIEENWLPPPISGEAAGAAVIRLHIELKRDGHLLRPAAVMEPARSPAQQAIADAAVRAVEKGQPYEIPPQQYEQCRDVILRFNPRDMYGR
jgi:hypothetical protein